jgi:FixJ family two-component response regulator
VTAEPLVSIVEDDEPLRMALIGLLRSSGYDASGFASAEDFLQSGKVQHFDCIITDIQMPGMSGIDLKMELIARQFPVPVIMITARGEPGLKQRAIASGAVGFLSKPFDGDELLHVLKAALGGREPEAT